MQTGKHILFWIIVTLIMVAGFGSTFNDYGNTFFFVSFLLPVAIATSYFFNYYLVPQYLLHQKKVRFALYTIYTIIVSLFLQMIVITLSFIIIANYQYSEMDPLMSNIFVIATVIYLIVFIKAFVLLYQRVLNGDIRVKVLTREKNALKKDFISVRVNRENRQIKLENIIFLESLADYVRIHTTSETVTTKETISSFEQTMPEYFIRIHRSYIVNRHFVLSYSTTSVHLSNSELPVSRTFKKQAMALFSNIK